MLQAGRVHGDLSAYNVLYWEGRISIIDFPQAFDPMLNPNAYSLFARDVERLCQYFARYDLCVDARGVAREIWRNAVPELGMDAGELPT
jgi:RIO kinase 1